MRKYCTILILAVMAFGSAFADDKEFNSKVNELSGGKVNEKLAAIQWFAVNPSTASAGALKGQYDKEKEAWIRMKIVNAWTIQQGQGALENVLAALKDPDQSVREEAALSLAYFGNSESVTEALAAMISDEKDESIKKNALNTLSSYGDDKAADEMVKQIKNEKNRDIRKYAVKSLRRMQSQKAKNELKKLEKDSDKEISDAAKGVEPVKEKKGKK